MSSAREEIREDGNGRGQWDAGALLIQKRDGSEGSGASGTGLTNKDLGEREKVSWRGQWYILCGRTGASILA
jgi:hypothetical protein